MMKKGKMLLTLGLSALLALSSVGCGSKEAANTEKENVKESTTSTDTKKEESKEEAKSQHYDIKIGLWNSGDFGSDEYAEMINEKFNVSVEFENFSFADYLQKLNVAASSGNLPDMFAHPAWSNPDTRVTFFSWAEQEVIQPIPEDLSAYPNIRNVMDNYDFLRTSDGNHYMIPRIAWQPENAFMSQALWVRKDWMENLGITKMPETLDEVYELLRAFTFDDPDGNGKDDTYGLTKGVEELWVFNAYQTEYLNWIEEDGKFIPGMVSKNNIPAIEFLKRLYDEGILDPDYATLRDVQGMDKFASGKVGVIGWTTEAYHLKENLVDKMKKINPEWGPEIIDIIGPVASELGDPITNPFDNYWSGTLFNGALEEGKLARCLEIYDYLLSDEALEIGRFGFEGEHFAKNGDAYESLLPVDPATNLPKNLNTVLPTTGIKTLVTWDVDGRWLQPSMPKVCVELEQKAYKFNKEFENTIDARTRYITTPAVSDMQINDLYWETVYKCVMASDDVEADFNAFVDNVMKNKGVAKAIEEFNAEADRLGVKAQR